MEPRYTVISADSHCGADVVDYRPYLASKFHDEFDAWAATYEVPFADLLAPSATGTGTPTGAWPSTRPTASWPRSFFPNTVPPFFEEGNLVALPPSEADYDRRFAGVQAHNRWVADFCTAAPGRRAGVIQVFVNPPRGRAGRDHLGGRAREPLRRHPAALDPTGVTAASSV